MIDAVSQILEARGFERMPVEKYEFYKSSDEEILEQISRKNERKLKLQKLEEENNENKESQDQIDKSHGTKMVIKQYLKWLDIDDKKAPKVKISLPIL